MKKRFLVVYDYGQGGVWAFVHARSADAIKRRLPDLKVVEDVPQWMDDQELKSIEDKMSFDLDKPHGWLAEFIARREAEGAAAG